LAQEFHLFVVIDSQNAKHNVKPRQKKCRKLEIEVIPYHKRHEQTVFDY